MAKEIPGPAGKGPKTDGMALALSRHCQYIYMLVDLRGLTLRSWGNLGVGLGVPMENPHCACIATTWLGTWQYLKVDGLGLQTRCLCKLALILGQGHFAALHVAPDVGIE
jgi:hypothetical protein